MCVVMPDPVIYSEKYQSHYVQRQGGQVAAVDRQEVKQVFHSSLCRPVQ